jgi:hypothetical protein
VIFPARVQHPRRHAQQHSSETAKVRTAADVISTSRVTGNSVDLDSNTLVSVIVSQPYPDVTIRR